CGEFSTALRKAGIDPIFLLAPTSSQQRFDDVAAAGSGFIYYVSLKGVTGVGAVDFEEVGRRVEEIRSRVGLPIGVGFGIRDAESAQRIGRFADAVVIGSRIIEEIENSPREEAVTRVTTLMRGLREALNSLEETR
ncbi:MAG TPA: tryptophan synthase subunit alpha, partial [Azoarcus sp.]|nr:tryptophan synthase subunit alpha [Azoarcus sp.]